MGVDRRVAPSVPLCRTKEEPFASAHVTVTESIPRWTIERRCPCRITPTPGRHRQLYKCYGFEPSPRQGTSVSTYRFSALFSHSHNVDQQTLGGPDFVSDLAFVPGSAIQSTNLRFMPSRSRLQGRRNGSVRRSNRNRT